MIGRIEHLNTLANTGAHPRRYRGPDQAVQHLLRLQYRNLIDTGRPLPPFGDIEMRFYSQNGEDGIIQLLVAAVETDTKRSVEICAGDGIECNTANLLVNHGWTGLLVDGGEELVTRGREFYEWGPDTFSHPPTLRRAWVTAENVNQLVREADFDGEIDLLSLDLDGVDYWIWKALDCVRPRIVVAEFNDAWGPNESVTVPYDPQFAWQPGSVYLGASLAAMCKLGAEKGYRLVGTQRYGFNAFFVRDDLAGDTLLTVKPEDCLGHPKAQGQMARLPEIEHLPWVHV
ncbi:MAG TPA: hypothetical protein VKG43_12560 [Acidimicrobiales bacterium]|nr:hypothetical protein [Acidimicrobiales bacterium]